MLRDLQAHHWPGNVRELEAVVERAIISSPGPTLRVDDELALPRPAPPPVGTSIVDGNGPRTLTELERDHILATLAQTYWRVEGEAGAAARLGMNPSTLRSRMRKLGIRRPGSRPLANA